MEPLFSLPSTITAMPWWRSCSAPESDDLLRLHPRRRAADGLGRRGAEMRQAIGTAVFFGMLGLTLFGLAVTRVFYNVVRSTVDAFQRRLMATAERCRSFTTTIFRGVRCLGGSASCPPRCEAYPV
jgi:hypothetical protein